MFRPRIYPRIYPRLPAHHRTFATRIPIPTTTAPTPTLQQRLSSPLPITSTCPPPTCACVPSPAITHSLDIDHTTTLAGALPRYHRHLLISTARSDWASKIELDPINDGGLAQRLKSVAATHGLRDPFAPTLVTNSSFSPESADFDSAYVFPGNTYLPRIPRTTAGVTALLQRHLLPGAGAGGVATGELEARPAPETLVLICSHGSRDSRCGLIAPALLEQFTLVLRLRGLTEENVKVACTSHLSGHKFAGNVVVYLPMREGHAALGVWYGRVGPEHVEGIVDETILGGRVVGELCRGVVGGEAAPAGEKL